jgi:hypothetical protein
MNMITTRSLDAPYLYHELLQDRIRDLRREAAEQRLIAQVRRLQRARRDAERASARLRRALLRLA